MEEGYGASSVRRLRDAVPGHEFRRISEDRGLTELARLELPGVDNLKPRRHG
jgi:hypothetical protein